MATEETERRPRDYICVKCGNPARPMLTDAEYSSPEYEYLPKNCSNCGAKFMRLPKEAVPPEWGRRI
jgi:DNA-directed RNA polymerase subunit RPC12/RpoP